MKKDHITLHPFMQIARDVIAQEGGVGEVVQLGPFAFAVQTRDGTWVRVEVSAIADPHKQPPL